MDDKSTLADMNVNVSSAPHLSASMDLHPDLSFDSITEDQAALEPSPTCDAKIFNAEGNSRKGFRCGPCKRYKKGCKGDPPVCDTCKLHNRADRCNFTTTPEASKDISKADKLNPQPVAHGTLGEALISREKLMYNSSDAEEVEVDKDKVAAMRREQEATARIHNCVLSREEMSETINDLEKIHNETPASMVYPFAYSNMDELSSMTLVRTVNVISPLDEATIQDPDVKVFIKKYGAPFSKNLLPVVEEIAASIDTTTTSDDTVHADKAIGKSKLEEMKMKLNQVWDIVLAYAPVEEEEEEYILNMSKEEKVAWLRGTERNTRPVSERNVEDFFFAYVCVSIHGWEQGDISGRKASLWYGNYIVKHWCYVVQSIDWRKRQGFDWKQNRDWLAE